VKIIKIGATKCSILWLKYTKFDFGWGSAPDPAGGAYSAPPDPLVGLREPTAKAREGREKEGGGRKGRVKSAAPYKASCRRLCLLISWLTNDTLVCLSVCHR